MRFIDYDKSDLRLEIFKQIFFIEAAVKSNRNFGFVSLPDTVASGHALARIHSQSRQN